MIAMIMKSGMLHEPLAISIDFGTNAEMAQKIGSRILVGSAAAGPASLISAQFPGLPLRSFTFSKIFNMVSSLLAVNEKGDSAKGVK